MTCTRCQGLTLADLKDQIHDAYQLVVADGKVCVPVSSQGQGGQVAAGALNAAGLGILGALMPQASTANTASNVQSVTVTAPRGHHR